MWLIIRDRFYLHRLFVREEKCLTDTSISARRSKNPNFYFNSSTSRVLCFLASKADEETGEKLSPNVPMIYRSLIKFMFMFPLCLSPTHHAPSLPLFPSSCRVMRTDKFLLAKRTEKELSNFSLFRVSRKRQEDVLSFTDSPEEPQREEEWRNCNMSHLVGRLVGWWETSINLF